MPDRTIADFSRSQPLSLPLSQCQTNYFKNYLSYTTM